MIEGELYFYLLSNYISCRFHFNQMFIQLNFPRQLMTLYTGLHASPKINIQITYFWCITSKFWILRAHDCSSGQAVRSIHLRMYAWRHQHQSNNFKQPSKYFQTPDQRLLHCEWKLETPVTDMHFIIAFGTHSDFHSIVFISGYCQHLGSWKSGPGLTSDCSWECQGLPCGEGLPPAHLHPLQNDRRAATTKLLPHPYRAF